LRIEITEAQSSEADLECCSRRGHRIFDLVGKIPEVEAKPSIEKDRCPWIIDSRRLMYGGNQGLRVETPRAQITK
jgi:hypothetical protein